MKQRGSIVTVAAPGNYGNPLPALVIQPDLFADHPSVTVLMNTSELRNGALIRHTVAPTPANGLEKVSQVMIDKAITVPVAKIGNEIGKSCQAATYCRSLGSCRCSWVLPNNISDEHPQSFCVFVKRCPFVYPFLSNFSDYFTIPHNHLVA